MKTRTEKIGTLTMKRIFADIAYENRIRKNYTQEQLSEIVGITDVYLRCIENGKNAPNWIIWMKLCTALGIDVFEIQQKFIEICIENKSNLSDF